MVELEDRLELLENELAQVKLDIKQVLVDLKELILRDQNPLAGAAASTSAPEDEGLAAVNASIANRRQ